MQIDLPKLAALIGLTATATEADVTKRFGELNALDARLKSIEGMNLTALTAAPAVLELRLKKIEDRQAADAALETSNLVALFATEGKVPKKVDGSGYTVEELGKTDVTTLKLLHANTPATVPMTGARKGREASVSNLSDESKLVALNAAVAEHRKSTGCDVDAAHAHLRVAKPQLFA